MINFINFDDYFHGYDPIYDCIFHACWTDWEEDGWIFIFEKNKEYYCIDGGHSVMYPNNYKYSKQFKIDLYKISEKEVFEIIEEWSKIENIYRGLKWNSLFI